jgi:transposase
MCQEPHRLLFLDETGTTTNMTRLRGRAPCGERLKMAAPFGHWQTQTFVAGLRCDGLVAPWVLDGPMNGEAFETYIETQLAPTLVRGDVVIMDNLSSHKSERVAQLIRQQGAWPLFLPPYSPDLNPIEMAFAKLKELLRKLNARTIDQLWRAIGSVCSLFTPDQCWNFFRHCGYANAST